MALLVSDKEKKHQNNDILDYRLQGVELYQIAETMAVAVVSEYGGINQNRVKPTIISIVSHQICLNQILKIRLIPISNSMKINNLEKNVVHVKLDSPKL